MADLVDQGRCDAVPHHALTRHLHDRDRVLVATGKPGPGTADGRARTTLEVADDLGRLERETPVPAGPADRPPVDVVRNSRLEMN